MKKLMYIAAALLVLVGCQKKENVIENAPQNLVTITGGIDFSAQDGPNKVAAKEGWENVTSGNQVEFMWEEGDKIAVLTTDGTEIKQFTVSEILQDGKSATFTGEPLSGGMESYYVIYPYEFGVAVMQQGGKDAFFANQQYTGKLRPAVQGEGTNDSFTMNVFLYVIDLSLTGSVKLGKIVYHVDNNGQSQPYNATLSFGDGGFQLTDQPQHVTFTPCHLYAQGFTLSFYDTDNQLIMEKKSEKNITNVGEIISFATLEVKATAQTVDPKSIFTDKAAMKICFSDTNVGECSFTYVYHTDNTTFTVSEIIVAGVDQTESYKYVFSVVKGEGNKFTFHYPNPESYVDFDAGATPKATWIFSDRGFEHTTLTHLYVNGVDIIDQIKVTNLSKQK